jgi:hypothetical protein
LIRQGEFGLWLIVTQYYIQMLKFIPRHVFGKLDSDHRTACSARSFIRWHQCDHLLFMQLTGRCSLRDGVASLTARCKNLYQLGVKPVARSTFADANNKQPALFLSSPPILLTISTMNADRLRSFSASSS